jgi:NodT family efflux transporter outer membrane factor (OMF) lipoprotein
MLLGACSHTAIEPETHAPTIPSAWQRGGYTGAPKANWLKDFGNAELTSFVEEAVANNYSLHQERARLYQAEQSVVLTRANRFPTLNLTLDGQRRGADGSTITESSGIAIEGRWEVDLWGRLTKEQQASQLAYAAQQVSLQSAERDLAGRTAGTFFQVLEAKQLFGVARRRLDNAIATQDIVASGYRQGLNDALDLYLAKNQVERQEANYAQQEQVVSEAVADLQLLLARYPDGNLAVSQELPLITDAVPAGLPSELLTRRPDVQQAWLNLLAADADLAAAHKSRFPSLSLVGSTGTASAAFSEFLTGDISIWSVSGGLTQPIFNAGRLRAIEELALAEVQRTEQQYLDLVYSAFADVENAISRLASLRSRYESFLDAEKNSRAALNLALEQYQRGLVAYTTVLESQRQAFDAETTVVQLKNLLLQNRITLYLALGGEFSTETEQ